MCHKKPFVFSGVLLAGVFIVFVSLQFGQQPKFLHGNIFFDADAANTASSINVSYSYFKIEIIEIAAGAVEAGKPPKVLYTTYPDSSGYFTFTDVPEGKYRLRISITALRDGGLIDEQIQESDLTVGYDENGKQRILPIRIDVIALHN